MPNRKAAEAVILNAMGLMDPTGMNKKFYVDAFSTMSDKDFDAYMTALEKGDAYLTVSIPNLVGQGITVDNNLEVGKKLGCPFFHRLWYTDAVTGQTYLTNQEYLVLDLPVRRQIQTLENKISIPDDNKHIDELTDQPRDASKGASISFPEMLVLHAQDLNHGISELMKFRGGDLKAMNAMDREIVRTGGVSTESLYKLNTRVKSTVTLSILFKGMHLDNNF